MCILSRSVHLQPTPPKTMSAQVFGLVALPGEQSEALARRMSSLLEAAAPAHQGQGADPLLLIPAAGQVEAAALAQWAPRHCMLQPVSAGPAARRRIDPDQPYGHLQTIDLPAPQDTILAYRRECTAVAQSVALQSVQALLELGADPIMTWADLSQLDLASDPLASRFSSRPVRVQVEFATDAGRLSTLEGAVKYRTGAALLTGSRGERWPVERRVFDLRYVSDGPQPPGRMRAYRKTRLTVLARQLMRPFQTLGGAEHDTLTGHAWDWLVQYAPGEHGIVAEALFGDLYEPCIAR